MIARLKMLVTILATAYIGGYDVNSDHNRRDYYYFMRVCDVGSITINAQTIIDNLKEYWEESAPNAERLWMG